jgi:hypothetical protein
MGRWHNLLPPTAVDASGLTFELSSRERRCYPGRSEKTWPPFAVCLSEGLALPWRKQDDCEVENQPLARRQH